MIIVFFRCCCCFNYTHPSISDRKVRVDRGLSSQRIFNIILISRFFLLMLVHVLLHHNHSPFHYKSYGVDFGLRARTFGTVGLEFV